MNLQYFIPNAVLARNIFRSVVHIPRLEALGRKSAVVEAIRFDMLHRKQSSHSRPTAKCPNHAFCPPHLHHIGRFRKKSGHGIVEIGTREVFYSAAATARAIDSLAPVPYFHSIHPSIFNRYEMLKARENIL
jgi:hypothetical protein